MGVAEKMVRDGDDKMSEPLKILEGSEIGAVGKRQEIGIYINEMGPKIGQGVLLGKFARLQKESRRWRGRNVVIGQKQRKGFLERYVQKFNG